MKKSKISLIRDLLSSGELCLDKEKLKKRDERINREKNEIMNSLVACIITILILTPMISDIFNVDITVEYLVAILEVIEYVVLLIFCRKCLIRDNEMALAIFIGSSTLSLSIINFPFFMKISTLYSLMFIIGLPILQYMIANIIYKRAMKVEE